MMFQQVADATAQFSVPTSTATVAAIIAALSWALWAASWFPRHPVHDPFKSAVLVTGCGRGIGRSLALGLAARGYAVVGTVRSQRSYDALAKELDDADYGDGGGQIFPVLLDVTNNEHIEPAEEKVISILAKNDRQLVGIVNNAGINPEGDKYAEDLKESGIPENALADPSVAESVFATNVIGSVRVTRGFLPLLVRGTGAGGRGTGRIVLIGSYFGSVAGALGLRHVYYEASKHALEGLADGMRRGLSKEGIDVSLVKPGNIQTDMNSFGEVGPDKVTDVVLHALEAKRPKHRYYPGKVKGMSARLLCTIFGVLPTWVTDKLL